DVYRFERDFQEAPAEWIVSATTGHFTDIRMAYGLPKQLNGAADPDIFERELEVDCISDEHQKMRTQLRLIANGSDLLILALDADMEGECIARQVAQVAEPRMRSHDVRRCWFTSLGQTHLLRALESLRDLNEAVADACEVRRHVDYRLGQAGTLALNAFAERHRPLLEGSLPKFFRNRHGRQHTEYAEDEEEKEAPALSYGPVQTAAIFLAWHHHISEKLKVKQESDKRWRVKLTLQSDLTGKFECFSDLIGEGAAQEQRDVILQHVRQQSVHQSS
ncbi:TOP3A, partial [Symbiodinium sp. CCMP2592]